MLLLKLRSKLPNLVKKIYIFSKDMDKMQTEFRRSEIFNVSNERFWQIFTNVKIRKTNIWGLEELKMFFRDVEERIVNIYKNWIKTNIRYYFCLNQQYACFN